MAVEAIQNGTTLEADAIIVGSGAGGSSVADVLTRAGLSVMMFEEGPSVLPEEVSATSSDSFLRAWRHAGLTAALGRTPISYAEGRCVGGGTEINSAIFQRTPPELLDDWSRLYRIADFSESSLKPWYDRAAKAVNASLTPGAAGRPTEILQQAGAALGWKTAPLERGQRGCVGTNACSTVCPTGGKQSMSQTLLPQALGRGLRLFANARIERVTLNGSSATGVAGDAGGVPFTARAKTVFLCAGAIQTPALLQRSGLKGLAGRSLYLHPTLKVIAEWDAPVDAHLHRLPLAAITEFMPEQRIGGSVFSPATFALSLAEDWPRRGALLPEWRRFGIYYGMIRPRGRGAVRALPGLRDPLVSYRLAPEDWLSLGQIGARLAQAMFAAGAKRVIPSVTGHPGWMQAPGAAPLELPAGKTNLMTIHLFGSCPAGENRDACAVDSFGRVYDAENLVVADASLIPEAPGVNPQATIMALAFRAAEAYLAGAAKNRSAA
jgi:choline dehydrogenase-like flavoprotein